MGAIAPDLFLEYISGAVAVVDTRTLCSSWSVRVIPQATVLVWARSRSASVVRTAPLACSGIPSPTSRGGAPHANGL